MSPKYLTLLPFDFNPKLLGRMAEAILCLARRLTVLTIIHCSRFYDIRTSRITTFPTLRPRSTYLPTNDEDEHNDERRCLRQKRRRGGRGEKWYDAKKKILFRRFWRAINSMLDSHHGCTMGIDSRTPPSTWGHFLTRGTYVAICPTNRNSISHPMKWLLEITKNSY